MNLAENAAAVAACLRDQNIRIVFAESCTAGLVSATLSQTPGISQWHCGSSVTYRERTKQDWLGVSVETIAEHGVVSDPVAREMALGVLLRTVEADVSASITGDLGPDAPPETDGVVYIAVASCKDNSPTIVGSARHELQSSERRERQQEAAVLVFQQLLEILS